MTKPKVLWITIIFLLLFPGCQNNGSAAFDSSRAINVISREDGSGTRGAFVELFNIVQKNNDGTKKDLTTKEAVIAKQADVMLNSINLDKYAVGYISLGSLNDMVKALQIDGVSVSGENILNGSYQVSRPFNLAVKDEPSGLARDFINFILSAPGQELVSKNYIPIKHPAPEYTPGRLEGKIVIAGSSSVTPVMESLRESYLALNPKAVIEIQQSDSSSGMVGLIDGTCDIGMASRPLKDNELEKLTSITIALDGIAIVVNNANPAENLTKEQVKSIFTGQTLTWSDIQND